MSYFSDLSIKEIETDDRDKSYPAPEVQLQWKLKDLFQEALSYGITQAEIESLFGGSKEPILAADNELLHSYNYSTSPTLIMRCIKVALARLSKYRSVVSEDSAFRTEYNDNLNLRNTLLYCETGKAA